MNYLVSECNVRINIDRDTLMLYYSAGRQQH